LKNKLIPNYFKIQQKKSLLFSEQGRLDGAFCDYTENDKMEYLQKCKDFGVANIEMEATIFGALTHHAGIKAAIVCVALLNRLNGDQVRDFYIIFLSF
jgi:uridine phosphorylase